jgi:hypothetical protein
MRRTFITRVAVCAAVGSLLSGIATADHRCNGDITPIGTGQATVYVDNRGGDEVWVYRESNGTLGLQSGGANSLGIADTCAHPNPDGAVY